MHCLLLPETPRPHTCPLSPLPSLPLQVARTHGQPPAWDEGEWHYCADAPEGGDVTAQYVLVLDALNFCFWPSPTGMEYDALAVGLKRALETDPRAFDADRLANATEEMLRGWLPAPHEFPNMEERVRRVREVGVVLGALYGGLAANVVRAAKHSAVELVRLVTASFPGFRDEAVYKGRHVYFYKRAQIFVGDVWAAYGRQVTTKAAVAASSAGAGAEAGVGVGVGTPISPYAFYDMDALTCFADYRIPQLLHAERVMVYAPSLDAAILAREVLTAGGEVESEIRAATVEAVERLRRELGSLMEAAPAAEVEGAGGSDALSPPPSPAARRLLTSVEVDWYLWQEGEARKDVDLHPHHRVNTIFY
jgi:hypothetical protein